MGSYQLDNAGITGAINEIEQELSSHKVDSEKVIRARITAEEILLQYQKRCGTEVAFVLSFTNRLRQVDVNIAVESDPYDPSSKVSEEDRFYYTHLRVWETFPQWNYRNGKNCFTLQYAKKKRDLSLIFTLVALVLGIAAGLVARNLDPAFLTTLNDSWLTPLNDVIMGILRTASIFFIFFSIIDGICGMGDMSTFNRIGKKMILRLITLMAIASVLTALAVAFIFPLSDGGAASYDYSELWKTLLSIVPTNFIEAFTSGNSLQVAFLAVCVGIILLILGKNASVLTGFASQMNQVILKLIQGIISIMPFYIFISMFQLFSTEGTDIKGIYRFPLYFFIFCTIVMIYLLIKMRMKYQVSIPVILRKLMPVLLTGLITASSAATITSSFETCEKKLGIDRQIIMVGWPLCNMILFYPQIFDLMLGCMVCAQIFHMPVSLAMLITFTINVFILSIASPKFPGSAISLFTIMLGILNIPHAALSLLVPILILTDHYGTMLLSMKLHEELLHQADRAGMLNKEILRS